MEMVGKTNFDSTSYTKQEMQLTRLDVTGENHTSIQRSREKAQTTRRRFANIYCYLHDWSYHLGSAAMKASAIIPQ